MQKRKFDKFDVAVYAIFLCAIVVSFSHTIELYKSSNFDIPIEWMNSPSVEKWLGKDFFNLALFATIAAEFAFTVGLWGLFEAFRREGAFPGWQYKWTWGMFLGGLLIVGWSNIGGTVGYEYLFGDPVKGIVLGLSIPYFVLNAVLVNFSRSTEQRSIELAEQTSEQNEQRNEHEQVEQNEHVQSKLVSLVGRTLNTYKQVREQIKQTLSEHQHNKHEQPKHVQGEHTKPQEIQLVEQDEHKQHEQGEQAKTEQIKHVQPVQIEQTEQRNIEQPEQKQVNKQSEREQQKRKLYIVNSQSKVNKVNTQNKVDQAVQCALEMMKRNEQFTVRKLAKIVGCSPTTAQNAINRLKERKQA